MQGVEGGGPGGHVSVDEGAEDGHVAEELGGAVGGEGLADEEVLPEEVLELGEGVAPDAAEGGGGEGAGEEVEVAAEDADGFVEFGRDGVVVWGGSLGGVDG